MSDLIALLQGLGDATHDDLSVAHDALEEIIRLRAENAELRDALDRHAQHLERCAGDVPNDWPRLMDYVRGNQAAKLPKAQFAALMEEIDARMPREEKA